MSYHLKRAPHPLKLPTGMLCSSFVLPDNSVCFIGTKHCKEETRQKFLQFVFGKDDDTIPTFSDCDEPTMEEEIEAVTSSTVGKGAGTETTDIQEATACHWCMEMEREVIEQYPLTWLLVVLVIL